MSPSESTSLTPAPVGDHDPATHENQHVHAVYDEIAPHFSATRYKPWPIIADFLASLPAGSVGLDSGTGNGKYLSLGAGNVWTVGLDRSRTLLEIAQGAGGARREVVWGDALGAGWRAGAFDYALSIATIHHLATPARRRAAIETLLRCVSPARGRVLVYVWAVEQDALSKRALPPTGEQDVFVPWVLHKASGGAGDKVLKRYYHMFAAGELHALARDAARALGLEVGAPRAGQRGVEIVREGWERSNWYIELRRWEA